VAYYPMIVGGIVLAWMGGRRSGPTPGRGFDTVMTSMMLGFFYSYVWSPFLPARGPWENLALTSTLRDFEGVVFTPLVEMIIAGAAVSGACFPSAHISGTAGLIIGLARPHPRAACWFTLLAAGLGIACVYTRYHHAVDVLAGALAGLAGGGVGLMLTARHK
jgi:membrane-associated phospholipid phosphatase